MRSLRNGPFEVARRFPEECEKKKFVDDQNDWIGKMIETYWEAGKLLRNVFITKMLEFDR